MRLEDIRFKAKTVRGGQWVEGDLIHGLLNEPVIRDKDALWHTVDHSTVCQYTGLKDKEGTPIYENDIIIYKDNFSERRGTVNWNAKQAVFCFGCGYLFYFLPENIKVIGNKFDKEV